MTKAVSMYGSVYHHATGFPALTIPVNAKCALQTADRPYSSPPASTPLRRQTLLAAATSAQQPLIQISDVSLKNINFQDTYGFFPGNVTTEVQRDAMEKLDRKAILSLSVCSNRTFMRVHVDNVLTIGFGVISNVLTNGSYVGITGKLGNAYETMLFIKWWNGSSIWTADYSIEKYILKKIPRCALSGALACGSNIHQTLQICSIFG